MANRRGKSETVHILFSYAPKSLWTVTVAMKLRCLLLGRKAMTNLYSVLVKQRYHFVNKDLSSQSYGFSIVMYRCESWTTKKVECQSTETFKLVLEKTLESPLDCEIKPVSPTGKQLQIFIGRTNAEAETPIFWPPDVKSQLTGKDPDAGED